MIFLTVKGDGEVTVPFVASCKIGCGESSRIFPRPPCINKKGLPGVSLVRHWILRRDGSSENRPGPSKKFVRLWYVLRTFGGALAFTQRKAIICGCIVFKKVSFLRIRIESTSGPPLRCNITRLICSIEPAGGGRAQQIRVRRRP